MHDRLNQALNWLFGAGRVTKTEIEAESKDVICTIEVETGEVAERQYLGTHAAILMRPAPPTSDGAMGVLVMRWGDARKPFMTDEQRWQVDVAEGEVVVRAFGDNASRIRLKPNGDVVIEAGGNILLGSGTAAEALALATKVHEELDKIRNAITTAAVGGAPDAGAAFKANIIASLEAPTGVRGDVGSESVKADD